MNRLSSTERAAIIRCLVEGNSIRSTARMTGAARNTITTLLVQLGGACSDYMDRVLRNLFDGLPLVKIGQVTDQPRLTIFGSSHGGLLIEVPLTDLKAAWQTPLGL